MIITDNEIRFRQPDDLHLHLRDGDMLEEVIRDTALVFKRALVMPNLRPRPVLTAQDALAYKARILAACVKKWCAGFEPLMTIQITDKTTPSQIQEARKSGVVAGKVYPLHGTTNADNGVSDLLGPKDVYKAMQEVGMVLCVHAEMPHEFVLDRERACLGPMRRLCDDYPQLRVIWEHISTADAATMVTQGPDNLFGTITAHHLVLTLDDILGQGIKPDHHCMPVPKTPRDRDAVIAAAISGKPKFFFGSDSAPHEPSAKYCQQGAAGVFSAPIALPLLAKVFEVHGALDRLESFVSVYGAQCYKLPLNEGQVVLGRDSWKNVRPMGSRIRPFMLDEQFEWEVTETPGWRIRSS